MNSTSRPLTNPLLTDDSGYCLTREQLLFDLYIAYYDAARHKHKMAYVVKFERDLRQNLEELCDDLLPTRIRASKVAARIMVSADCASTSGRHRLTGRNPAMP